MSLKLAREFATALENMHLDEASQFLAEDCGYHYWEGNYEGRANIVAIYRQNDLQSRKVLDEVIYSSEVEEMEDGSFKIHCLDKLRKGHRWHEHRFFEIIKFKDNSNRQFLSVF
jgi:hypothetical protein